MSIAYPEPASTPSPTIEREAIYQQALNDFAITDLLTQLQNFSRYEINSQLIAEPESELIAALLVEQLAKTLDSHLVVTYLKAIRQGNQEVVLEPISMECPQSTDLPVDFPTAAPTPCFIYGDRLRLCPVPIDGQTESETDTGRCIGHYYAYAPHHCHWMWKYVIWLDKDLVSASWCVATTAWEDELEPVILGESVS